MRKFTIPSILLFSALSANSMACVVTTSPTDWSKATVLDISIDAISVNPVGKSGSQAAEIARKELKNTASVACSKGADGISNIKLVSIEKREGTSHVDYVFTYDFFKYK